MTRHLAGPVTGHPGVPRDRFRAVSDIRATRSREAATAAQLDDAYASGDLTREAYAAALGRLQVTRFPVGFSLGPCPGWCRTDHAAAAEFERTEGVRAHEAVLVRLPALAANRQVTVSVSAVDSFDECTRGPAGIAVSSADLGLCAAKARRLAAALLDAGDLVDAWRPGAQR